MKDIVAIVDTSLPEPDYRPSARIVLSDRVPEGDVVIAIRHEKAEAAHDGLVAFIEESRKQMLEAYPDSPMFACIGDDNYIGLSERFCKWLVSEFWIAHGIPFNELETVAHRPGLAVPCTVRL